MNLNHHFYRHLTRICELQYWLIYVIKIIIYLFLCFRLFFTSFPKFLIRKYTNFSTRIHGYDSIEFSSTLYFVCGCAFSFLLYYSDYLVVVLSSGKLKTVRIETMSLLFVIDFICIVCLNASHIVFNICVLIKQMNRLLLRSGG